MDGVEERVPARLREIGWTFLPCMEAYVQSDNLLNAECYRRITSRSTVFLKAFTERGLMVEFYCSCGEPLRVPESLSDQEGACPRCGEMVRVPVAGVEGWSRLIVVGLKEPILAWPLMEEHPDTQGRTLIPGQVNFYAWVSVWIALGAMIRQESPELAVVGWSGVQSLNSLLQFLAAFIVLNVVTVHFCWAVAGDVYFRFTGRTADSDRAGFAAAGGYDMARWLPLVTLVAVLIVYRLTWSGMPDQSSSGLRQLWVFVLLIAVLSPVVTWLTARIVFGISIGRNAAVEGLIRALDSPDPNVRFDATQTLARWGNERAVRPLVHALHDSHDNVRWAAAHALRRMGDRRAAQALRGVLDDSKESIAREARQALQQIERRTPPSRGTSGELRWEKVKVFISSTFNDMHAERDFLVKSVLPRLREWCARRRLLLIDVDLRWGVTERDATHNRSVVQVCLSRIDECDPFFLCFLGQRRGWVPGADDVSPETLERFPRLRHYVGKVSVTEMEILHAVLEPFHEKTSDSSRNQAARATVTFYLRDPAALQFLPDDPPQLRRIYLGDGADRTLKHWRSSTIPESGCRVRDYEASWDSQAQTPELALSLECPYSDPVNQQRWRAQWAEAGIVVPGESVLDADLAVAKSYNDRLCAGRLSAFHVNQVPLSEVVIDDLQRAIISRYPDRADPASLNELTAELEQHSYNLAVYTEGFIDRARIFGQLDAGIQSRDPKLIVVAGAGGVGKSMLLANWIERRRLEGITSGAIWLYRFLGLSDASADVDSLLRSLLLELRQNGGAEVEIPAESWELRVAFHEAVRQAARWQDVVLVMDGLDRLSTRLEVLDWLMIPPPEGVRIIVSLKSDDRDAQRLLQRWKNDRHVTLIEIPPITDLNVRRQMVQAYLSLFFKELDEQDQESLANAEGAENPLFLQVVLSELRVFGSFANLRTQIREVLGTTPIAAFDGVLRRIERDVAYTALEPNIVAPIVFGALAHARRGLHTSELIEIVERLYPWLQGGNPSAGDQRHAAAADAVHFQIRQVRPFLTEHTGRVGFFYQAFRIACRERYGTAQEGSSPSAWHHHLVQYFASQPLYLTPETRKKIPNRRKLEELPWQLAHAGLWSDLNELLTDLNFLDAKCQAELVQDLLRDFALVPGDERSERLRIFAQFVVRHRQIFARDGTLLLPFAWNYASSGPVVEAAERCLQERGWDSSWVKLLDRPPLQTRPAMQRTLEGHRGAVTGVAIFGDRRILVSADSTGGLRVWDLSSGRLIRDMNVPGQVGINKIALTFEGQLAATAHVDGTVRVWHVDGGTCLHTFTGHRGPVCSVVLTEGLVVSGGNDGTIRVWSLSSGRQERVLKGHFGAVLDLAGSPSGTLLVSAGWDCTVQIWNLATGTCLRRMEGHRVSVRGVAVAGEATLIATCSGSAADPTGTAPAGLADSDVRFWSADGNCLAVGKGHAIAARGGRGMGVLGSAVHAIALSTDGTLAVSGGDDRAVCVWDAEGRRLSRRFQGHTASVLAVAVDSERLEGITGSADGTVRVWHLQGDSSEHADALRRVEHHGCGLHVDSETLSAVMWSNLRLRGLVLLPLLAVAVGVGIAFPVWGALVPARPYDLLWRIPIAFVMCLLFLYLIGWRVQLQGSQGRRTIPALRPVRRVAGSLLSVLTPLFPVVKCPCCGQQVCGRSRMFHCANCGWQDSKLK